MTQKGKEAQEKIKDGMHFSDRCQFCRDFGEKAEPYLCPECVERIKKLGYRKLSVDEGLLLTPEEIGFLE